MNPPVDIELTCFLGSGMPLRSRSVRCIWSAVAAAPVKAAGGDDRRWCCWCADRAAASRCSEPVEPIAAGGTLCAAGIRVFSSRRIVLAHSLVSRMFASRWPPADTAVVTAAVAAAEVAVVALLLGETSGDELVDEDVEPCSDEANVVAGCCRWLLTWLGCCDCLPYDGDVGGWFCCLYCSKTSLISRCTWTFWGAKQEEETVLVIWRWSTIKYHVVCRHMFEQLPSLNLQYFYDCSL